MPLQTSQPVIIVKRSRNRHRVHQGGAWKVAYADFVTAMLSLFIVLWLLSSSEQIKKAVGGYFTDPSGRGKDVGNGLRGAGGESLSIRKDDMNKLKEKLELAIKDSAAMTKIKEHVVFTVTSEGLRVELLEGDQSTFFESASSKPTDFGKDLLKKLAEEIGKLPNRVTMEGHTDSRPFSSETEYSNWELSADRANAARRWMVENGLRPDQVSQIRGYADQSPRDPLHPDSATNRRVSLVILYQSARGQGSQNPGSPSPDSQSPDSKGEASPGLPDTTKAGTASPGKAPVASPENAAGTKPEPATHR
jgi:chemotaxis protein MotB